MTKVYALERTDGGVAIMRCLGEADPASEISRWHPAQRAQLTGVIAPLDPATIPADRTFRDAWTPALAVDMVKARSIHMGRIRGARDAELERLDLETIKAVGSGDAAKLAEIEAQKRTLRDLPQTFDLSGAATPDALKTLWPAQLPKPA